MDHVTSTTEFTRGTVILASLKVVATPSILC